MYFCNRSVLIRPEHAAGQAVAQFDKPLYAPNTQRETTGCVILHQQYLRSAPFASTPLNPDSTVINVDEYSPVP